MTNRSARAGSRARSVKRAARPERPERPLVPGPPGAAAVSASVSAPASASASVSVSAPASAPASASAPAAERPKPLLRGVLHQGAFYVSLSAAAALIYLAPTSRAAGAAAIYGASLAALYGIGALYHRPNWPPEARQVVRRLDHAVIFVFIAGGFTPLSMLIPTPEPSSAGLWIVWIGAALGVVKSIVWARAPRMATVIPGALLSLAVLWQVPQLSAGMGPGGLDLLLVSAAIHALGALVYVLRRPDPFPRVFGYHEVFHALVIVASVCHFVLVVRVVLASG